MAKLEFEENMRYITEAASDVCAAQDRSEYESGNLVISYKMEKNTGGVSIVAGGIGSAKLIAKCLMETAGEETDNDFVSAVCYNVAMMHAEKSIVDATIEAISQSLKEDGTIHRDTPSRDVGKMLRDLLNEIDDDDEE